MSIVSTKYFNKLEKQKAQCTVCPRECKMSPGQRGLCYVRGNENGKVVLHTYGRSSGFCVDPIEKKPLNHFLPGSPVLSFGTAGCNLACKFCQNWDISKSREMDTLQAEATPKRIVDVAHMTGSKSIAFTYNDPVIFLEYAKDVALEAKKVGIKSVAVTAGYINEKPREEFFSFIDAANVDLKAFNEKFYKEITGGELAPILDTLKYLKQETNVWFELTTLLIPGLNDSEKEIHEKTQWIVEHLGADVPIHFTAFHPDFKIRDIPPTPYSTLKMARDIAMKNGIRYAYTGNVHDNHGSSTYCHHCHKKLIERDWYEIGAYHVTADGTCQFCNTPVAGQFSATAGDWGAKRLPVVV
jgi:pyruvate formate lyase activating enzyme